MQSPLLKTLAERGFLNQCTDTSALDAALVAGKLTGYIGFDLTAPSLHVGSLIQIMMLKHMFMYGQKPVVLLGTATTKIGDPTGKTESRQMLSDQQIVDNRTGIMKVFDNMVGCVQFVENDWFAHDISLLQYLRDYGKHFTVNKMMAMDSVKARMASEQGLSFLEFNYMLFQAIDFHRLHERHGCMLQIGGSDQWGNITAGVDLVRRMTGTQVFGLTTPLFTNSAGDKMGKTANGTIWLDPNLTPPYDFWQFWRNIEDAKVEECFKLFTLMPMPDIAAAMKLDINDAKAILATAVTKIVHGELVTNSILSHTGKPIAPVLELTRGRHRVYHINEIMIWAKLATSNKDADRLAANGGVRIDGKKVWMPREALPVADIEFELSVGKQTRTIRMIAKP